MRHQFPQAVGAIGEKLKQSDYKAYLVGGCVRDFLLGREPKDWDIATDAKPEEVQKLFSAFAKASADKPATVYENQFGTVGVKTDSDDPALKVVEVTTLRLEGKYTDKRHPDEIRFAKTIEEDLSRRDFTINAMAMKVVNVVDVGNVLNVGDETKHIQQAKRSNKRSDRTSEAIELIDPFHGQNDLASRIIRTVGNPKERFNEDALRLMRAVRLAVELDFQIEPETRKAIEAHAGLLEVIAKERIRDEFVKILMCGGAARGILLLEELGLLKHVLPELREGLGVSQNKHHIYTVFEHNIRALDYAVRQNYSLEVRLAALLHDVGKPRAKRGEGPNATFHGHEYVGAKMVLKMLDRLRFSRETVERVAHLVRSHMFYYNVGEVSAAGVRRFLARVGVENIDDIMKVREADRIGSGVPKAVVYKMRHLLFMIEKVRRDPVSPKMLEVDGNDVMRIAGIPAGPKVGQILSVLLEEVLEDPKKNEKEKLESRIRDLAALSDEKLLKMTRKAKAAKEEFETDIEEEIKKKYYV